MDQVKSEPASYLALPPAGRGPGILLLHAWWGLNGFFRAFADRLAREGYVVVCPDLFGGKVAGTVEEARALAGEAEADQASIREKAFAGLEALRTNPALEGKMGAIGFSFGAPWCMVLATAEPRIEAVTLFYGAYDPAWAEFFGAYAPDFSRMKAAVQGHFADPDEFEPLASVRKMEAALEDAGLGVEIYLYPDAGHWFMEDDKAHFQPEAAHLAWRRMVDFLNTHLRG